MAGVCCAGGDRESSGSADRMCCRELILATGRRLGWRVYDGYGRTGIGMSQTATSEVRKEWDVADGRVCGGVTESDRTRADNSLSVAGALCDGQWEQGKFQYTSERSGFEGQAVPTASWGLTGQGWKQQNTNTCMRRRGGRLVTTNVTLPASRSVAKMWLLGWPAAFAGIYSSKARYAWTWLELSHACGSRGLGRTPANNDKGHVYGRASDAARAEGCLQAFRSHECM